VYAAQLSLAEAQIIAPASSQGTLGMPDEPGMVYSPSLEGSMAPDASPDEGESRDRKRRRRRKESRDRKEARSQPREDRDRERRRRRERH